MKNSIKSELWKAIRNRWFYLALVIGFLLSVWQIIAVVPWMTTYYLETGTTHGIENRSLFMYWMGFESFSTASVLFYQLFPLLAALPFGWSLAAERRSGYQNVMLLRQHKSSYFLSKYIACFVSGGLVIAVVLLSNLLINALIFPAIIPQVEPGLGLSYNQFLSYLYYTHPWVHGLLWIGTEFLWAGCFACFCMLLGQFIARPVVVLILPFVLLRLYNYAVQGSSALKSVSPLYMARLSSGYACEAPKVLTEIAILSLFSLLMGLCLYKKREVIA